MTRSDSVDKYSLLVRQLRDAAEEEGFILFGTAPAIESAGFSDLICWVESGYAAEMNYFASRRDAYRHPSGVMEGTRSIIALAFPYAAERSPHVPAGFGRVARYAWSGEDYHDVIHPKLKRLCGLVTNHVDGARARGVVDTAPLMEREVAQLAGIGWRGKNTLLLNKHLGSYFFLACILTNLDLPIDPPHVDSHCGTCTACLDACPTQAFPSPGVLDSSRCISYLTIEHRGPIPVELRDGIGDWLFGCDVCQEVCPWNEKHAHKSTPENGSRCRTDLKSLFGLTEDEFRTEFRKTPFWRTRRRGLLRNAAIVLGNQGDPTAIPTLETALSDDEPIVREAAQWAIDRLRGSAKDDP